MAKINIDEFLSTASPRDIIILHFKDLAVKNLSNYTDEERLIGDAAMNQQKKNFKNTLQFFTRYIGLNSDCVEQLNIEQEYTTYKIVPLENTKIGFEISIRGQT